MDVESSDLEQALSVFDAVRGRLFGIAYRMLGSASEAEDIVQETWIRWQATDRSVVIDPPAFLATTATRLALNLAQSARARHESYVGPWLPEPVDTSADPLLGAERSEVLGLAMLLLLEKLTPTERAAYVLREAFDYPYPQIAEIVQVSEVASRQLVSRARKHLNEERRAPAPLEEQQRLLVAFMAAARRGEIEELEKLFAEDVVSYSDGGGLPHISHFPVVGRERVAKFLHAFAPRFWPGVDLTPSVANGQPVALLSRGGEVFGVVALIASTEGIEQLFWVMNPDKLSRVAQRTG